MAGIRFSRLINDFIQCLEVNSATVIRLDVTARRPARIRIVAQGQTTECLVLLWTITPGGGGPGVRSPNERRIQLTNVDRLPFEPGVRTLLGGWSQEKGVFAFWDARRHIRFSQRSPSLQVMEDVLEDAGSIGIATYLRPTQEGQEVVVAVAPGSLLWYVQNGLPLHNAEGDAVSVPDLIEATPEEERYFIDSSGSEIEAARRFDLVQTMRQYRDAKFRPTVLQAYGYRCAVCRCDLKLVDAAHIVPITHPSSRDDVTNGLALCRLHHGAYDNALLGVQSSYRIVINDNAAERLQEIGLARGMEDFRSRLPDVIHVPSSLEARPAPENLRLGLEMRGWPSRLIT